MNDGLNSEQILFLKSYEKEKRLIAFNSVQAGHEFHGASSLEIESIVDRWVLIDYIDNGFVNSETPCECGKPLRYQYIVKHHETGQIKRLGIKHFEDHIGLKREKVNRMRKEFVSIEKEVEEISNRTRLNWSLVDELGYIPSMSEDMKKQIELGLSLSKKQMNKLEMDMKQQQKEKGPDKMHSGDDLFSFDSALNTGGLTEIQKDNIQAYMKKEIDNPRVIAEMLVKYGLASDERYSTGKPKIYPAVCTYMGKKGI
ncbi:DUF3895 domain-containing protein [Bacillus altitudinis]|uniref:DUF3895 domain-containing protein n=1 Tax=Bacillus altitudinis TaxID=293387 RepID=UPI0020BFAC21|nr:DUF3895 domain-containing protein [Bacillus altitudinis]MEC0473626.1 DUF3895 domain-containing protein [Bacillus altitudinis]